MAGVVVLWVLVWVLKNAAMDVAHAVKGTPNPRYQLKMLKAKQAGQVAPVQPRYGTREWVADLWADGLQAHTERRRRRTVDARRETPIDGMVDAVGVRSADAEPAPARDARPAGPISSVIHEGVPRYRYQCYTCGAHGGWHATPEEAGDEGTRHSCPKPNTPTGQSSPPPQPAASRSHRRWQEPAATEAQLEYPSSDGNRPPACPPASDEDTNEPPTQNSANVIPFPNRPKEDSTMSTTTTEVYGLDQSINYARQLEEFAGTHGPAGNEGYIGHLEQSEVSGAAISTGQVMQQAFEAARAAAEAHRKELEKQTGVQEAYGTNPDAGNKAYLTQGR